MRVVIIGSGLMGVSTAYFLARQGHHVTVLERREQAGMETSFANSGMVTPSQADPWNSPASFTQILSLLTRRDSPLSFRAGSLFSMAGWAVSFALNSTPSRFRSSLQKNALLANYSLGVFETIRAETALAYDFGDYGTLKLYRREKTFRKAVGLSRAMASMGVRLEILDARGVIEREPALAAIGSDICGGVYYPDDEAGDAHKFCRELAGRAAAMGCEFRFNTEVLDIRGGGGGIDTIITSAGPIDADAYVLAAGCYSAELGRKLGLSIPVQPIKGYSITIPLNGWRNGPRMPVIDDARHIAVSPLGGRLRTAGMAEFAGIDTRVRDDRIRSLVAFLDEIYPEFKGFRQASETVPWAGLRPYCCDGVPLIGPTPIANLYLNTGQGHLGWSLSAGSGKLLADHLSGRDTEIPIQPYFLDRFRVPSN